MCSGDRVMELDEPELNAFLRRMRAGFHRSVAAMARAGNDFEVDTSRNSPRECAEAVKRFLGRNPRKRAFDELRGRARGHDPSTG